MLIFFLSFTCLHLLRLYMVLSVSLFSPISMLFLSVSRSSVFLFGFLYSLFSFHNFFLLLRLYIRWYFCALKCFFFVFFFSFCDAIFGASFVVWTQWSSRYSHELIKLKIPTHSIVRSLVRSHSFIHTIPSSSHCCRAFILSMHILLHFYHIYTYYIYLYLYLCIDRYKFQCLQLANYTHIA